MRIIGIARRMGGGGAALYAMLTSACAPGLELAAAENRIVDPQTGVVVSAPGSPLRMQGFDDLLTYGIALSETYVLAADRVTAGQDAAALGIIASAATAVGGLAFGAPAAVPGAAGLAGGVLVAGAQYADAPSAIRAMLGASTQVACVVRAGQASLPLADGYRRFPEFNRQRLAIIQTGFMAARVELRRALIRELPDFAGTFSALQTASQMAEASRATAGDDVPHAAFGDDAAADEAMRNALKAANDTMAADAAACFLPTVIADAARRRT